MTEACAENEGKVLCRSQIKLVQKLQLYTDTNNHRIWNQLYICIHKNRKWRWENLHCLSSVNFKKYKEKIINAANISTRHFEKHECPIEINNCTGGNADHINGIWCPVPELKMNKEYQVYKKVRGGGWLYPVTQGKTYQWWIGNWDNFRRRCAFGKCRTKKINYDGGDAIIPPPWIHKKWFIWDNCDDGEEKWTWRTNREHGFTLKILKQDSELYKRISNLKDDSNKLTIQKMEMLDILKELYHKFPKEERKNLVDIKLKNYFNKASLCTLCFSIDKPISKCLHFDCIGACNDCRNEAKNGGGGDGSCCACGKQQIMECPICLDSHTEQYLKILPCKHCVCWKCFCNSYEIGRPLKKCPNCRIAI